MHLSEFKKQAEIFFRLDPSPIVPCTPEEVEALEKCIQYPLPEAYKEFLLWMGRSGGGFWVGSNCFYNDLKKIQIWARELLEEDHFSRELPKDAFVFFIHGGYEFDFFYLNGESDPPVYYYHEGTSDKTSFRRLTPRFSDLLMNEMETHIKNKRYVNSLKQDNIHFSEHPLP
jgi:hypothetical protein